jgi:hypothetical protein
MLFLNTTHFKKSAMKTQPVQQEILLMTTTTFSKRQWCAKDASHSNCQSHTQQLEEACWNGLIGEVLPEIIEKPASGKRLYLWHIRQARSFLQLELSDFPRPLERYLSISPACFLPATYLN